MQCAPGILQLYTVSCGRRVEAALEDAPTVVMEHLSEGAGTGLRAQGKQLDMEVQKTLPLMSRVVDMGLETVDIAMERKRKKMKAAAAMRTAAVNVQMTAVDLRTAAVNLIMESLEEADHLRSGKASLIGEELLVTRVATPEPMSMKAMG